MPGRSPSPRSKPATGSPESTTDRIPTVARFWRDRQQSVRSAHTGADLGRDGARSRGSYQHGWTRQYFVAFAHCWTGARWCRRRNFVAAPPPMKICGLFVRPVFGPIWMQAVNSWKSHELSEKGGRSWKS
jgi:hypothetical protein